jgi:hypothetical protein
VSDVRRVDLDCVNVDRIIEEYAERIIDVNRHGPEEILGELVSVLRSIHGVLSHGAVNSSWRIATEQFAARMIRS